MFVEEGIVKEVEGVNIMSWLCASYFFQHYLTVNIARVVEACSDTGDLL